MTKIFLIKFIKIYFRKNGQFYISINSNILFPFSMYRLNKIGNNYYHFIVIYIHIDPINKINFGNEIFITPIDS